MDMAPIDTRAVPVDTIYTLVPGGGIALASTMEIPLRLAKSEMTVGKGTNGYTCSLL